MLYYLHVFSVVSCSKRCCYPEGPNARRLGDPVRQIVGPFKKLSRLERRLKASGFDRDGYVRGRWNHQEEEIYLTICAASHPPFVNDKPDPWLAQRRESYEGLKRLRADRSDP